MSKIKIDKDKLYECTIGGIKLDITDLCHLSEYYEACCTGEYAYDLYDLDYDRDMLIRIGYEARYLMDKYNATEDEAIEQVIRNLQREGFEIRQRD